MLERKAITGFVNKAADFVLPPRCVVSGRLVETQGMVAPDVWRSLNFITAPFCDCCGRPFEYDRGGEKLLCGSCLADRPVYNKARAALLYDDASRELVLKFKHADQTHAVRAFLPWMQRAGAEILGEAEMLAPVPLHRLRLLRRRYNQAAIIARYLSRRTGIPDVPDLLARVRATPSQGRLNTKDRAKNVRRAFEVNPAYKDAIQDKNIVLIDDVYTTGSTVKECAKALLKAGCARVDILTLARAVRAEVG